MSKGFIFVVWVGLCQLCFISRKINKDSYICGKEVEYKVALQISCLFNFNMQGC
jgi:hypothetical protein